MNWVFHVTPSVLIPRPETEELVNWIVETTQNSPPQQIVDIGTGSGCIALSLALFYRDSQVYGIDKSTEALNIAQVNQSRLAINNVEWKNTDIFTLPNDYFCNISILVSNPPYVPEKERESLHPNVRDHEPELALFVPNNDPLFFYHKIASLGRSWLAPKGMLFFECHYLYAEEVKKLCQNLGYKEVELKEDLNAKPRMVKACI